MRPALWPHKDGADGLTTKDGPGYWPCVKFCETQRDWARKRLADAWGCEVGSVAEDDLPENEKVAHWKRDDYDIPKRRMTKTEIRVRRERRKAA